MALGRKGKVILGVIAAITLVASVLGLRLWWYRNASSGTRSGIVRKVSVKGPPYCKYLSVEMAVQGSGIAQTEVWEFSVDHEDEADPVVKSLKLAEKSGDRVTIDYRQDLNQWYRCTPLEYFAVGVEK